MTPIDIAPFWLRLATGLGAAVLTWSAAAIVGWRLACALAKARPAADRLAIGLALGYALIGSVVGVLGLFHVAYAAVAALVPVALLAASARATWAAVRGIPRFTRDALAFVRGTDWSIRIAIASCVGALLTACVAGALPAVWWDPIAYHLPIAAAAIAHGAFAFDPSMTQSGFPLLGEAAALPAFAIAGTSGAALVTLGAGCALAVVCGAIAHRIAEGSRWLAAALVMTCPLWLWLAPSFYVDIPFALFAVASIGIGIVSILGPSAPDSGSVLLAGALAGASAAVKYPGLEVALVSIALLAYSSGARGAIAVVCRFAVASIAVFGGWYVRTAVLTHDPLYPFLTAHLSADPATRAFAERYVSMTMGWCGGSGSIVDAIALPWRMLAGDSAQTYCGDVGYALRLGIVFFVAAVALARRAWPAAIAAFALTIAWFAGSRQDRFIVPALCLYAVVAAAGVLTAPDRLRRAGAVVLVALGSVAVAAQWTPSLIGIASNSIVPAFAYIAGAQTGDDYLARRLEFYPADEWLRGHVPPGAPVAALDDVRDYYAPAIWANPYYEPVINIDWTAPAGTRYRPLEVRGISYVIVNANRYYIGRTPTGVDWHVLDDDVRSGRLKALYSDSDVTVYELEKRR